MTQAVKERADYNFFIFNWSLSPAVPLLDLMIFWLGLGKEL